MRRTEAINVLTAVRDLREELVLAEAWRVKELQRLRAVVQEPRNRETVLGHGRMPSYLNPADVLRDLEKMRVLYYLVIPGNKNRAKPDLLISGYQNKVAAVQYLASRLDALEEGARQAGIGLDELPEEF